jgi:septum site-determining protein MinD
MLRVVGVVSGKGGAGKTMTVANLGLAIHELSQDVLLIDADLTASNLGLHLGLYSFQPFYIQNALKGEVDINKAVYIHPTGLRVIPSSLSLDYINANIFKLRSVLKKLNGLVFIDSPPGLDKEALEILRCCDDVLVVTNPDVPSITDCVKVIQIAKGMDKNILGIVLNRVEKNKFELKPHEIEMMTEVPIISIIPEDKNVKKSLFEKVPLIYYKPCSPASIELRRLAHMLIGMEYRPPRFSKLRNIFSKRSHAKKLHSYRNHYVKRTFSHMHDLNGFDYAHQNQLHDNAGFVSSILSNSPTNAKSKRFNNKAKREKRTVEK